MSLADHVSPPPLAHLLAKGPLALFLDFDGTLVELAASPATISIPPGLTEGLVRLSARLGGRLALVSGRSIEDLERHCGALAVECAGSHGVERRRADGRPFGDPPEPLPGEVHAAVGRFASENAVSYEPKPHGAALHSRLAPQTEERCALFMSDLAAAHGLVLKRGKHVAELVRPGADKGAAVRAFMDEAPFADGRPVFVGDDITDEDGFAAASELGGFGIAVGERPTRAARYGLAGPAAVKQWLGL
jgi:trehalose 6-phosphate phosphatase